MPLGADIYLAAQTGTFSADGPSVLLTGGIALDGFQALSDAGAVNASDYFVTLRDAAGHSLVWQATYVSAGPALTRVAEIEAIGAISDSASVQVYVWSKPLVIPASGRLPFSDGQQLISSASLSWDDDAKRLDIGAVKVGGLADYAQIAADGTVTLAGAATAWDDLMIPGFSVKLTGNSPPDLLGAFAGSSLLDSYAFDGVNTTEQVFFTVQMPHAWKEGSVIYPHVHVVPVSTNGGDTVERVIRFSLSYSWANINGTFGSPSTINMDTDPFVPNDSQWKQILCKPAAGIDGTGKTLSSMLVCRLFRNPADAVDTYPQDVAFLQFDFHYEIDAFGSSREYIK